MSDEQATGSQPAEEKTPAPTASLAETGVTDPPAEKAETSTAETAEKVSAAWPDDWRDKLAAGDDKLKNLLNRYTSPDAFAKAYRELRAAHDSRKPAKEDVDLPENPTDEQLAAYRKAKGVPEKPEDYEFEVPEGKELSDGEYEILMDFAKTMHGKNMPASVVKDISTWFLQYEETVAQKNADNAYRARMETEEKLRAEWGSDYKANVNLMSNVLQEHLGTGAAEFLQQPLMDGTRIGDNETFIRLMADMARKIGGSSADLYTTDVHTTGTSLETRKAELMKMMNDPDPIVRKKYWSAPVQDELQRIQTALVRRAG